MQSIDTVIFLLRETNIQPRDVDETQSFMPAVVVSQLSDDENDSQEMDFDERVFIIHFTM